MSDVTRSEFDALEARVTKLESYHGEQPPATGGGGPGVGVKPVSTLIETFGVNTFSSMDEHNVWGSWPADYRPEQVIKALQYMLGDSGFHFGIREYHYAGRESFQVPWIQQIKRAFPDMDVTMCVGANGSTNDVPTLLQLFEAEIAEFIEGLNEPNTNFGSGEVPVTVTMDIQKHIWGGTSNHGMIMGPSVVAGMPGSEGWITGYFGNELDNVNSLMVFGNGHYYPPHCPDIIGDGTSLTEYVGGLWTVYGNHEIMLTEFHPTLYNSEGNAPKQPGWNGTRDAYYTLLALLRCGKANVPGLWWYALFDYGTTYECGLFPKDATNPRPVADMLKYLCSVCKDTGDKYAQPDNLTITVNHDPEYYDIYGNSFGEYYVFIWQSANDVGGIYKSVDITLEQPKRLTEYDMIEMAEVQNQTNVKSIRIMLNNTVKMVRIR